MCGSGCEVIGKITSYVWRSAFSLVSGVCSINGVYRGELLFFLVSLPGCRYMPHSLLNMRLLKATVTAHHSIHQCPPMLTSRQYPHRSPRSHQHRATPSNQATIHARQLLRCLPLRSGIASSTCLPQIYTLPRTRICSSLPFPSPFPNHFRPPRYTTNAIVVHKDRQIHLPSIYRNRPARRRATTRFRPQEKGLQWTPCGISCRQC